MVYTADEPQPQHAWQDPTCDTDTTQAHPDPQALLREYAARNDSLGFFAGGGEDNEAWYFGAIECPGHLGGSDAIGVVMDYRIEELPGTVDSARFAVHYELAGFVSGDSTGAARFNAAPVTVTDSLLLVRTPFGWRIAGQPVAVFMSPSAVIRQSRLPAGDSARVDSLAAVRVRLSGRGA